MIDAWRTERDAFAARSRLTWEWNDDASRDAFACADFIARAIIPDVLERTAQTPSFAVLAKHAAALRAMRPLSIRNVNQAMAKLAGVAREVHNLVWETREYVEWRHRTRSAFVDRDKADAGEALAKQALDAIQDTAHTMASARGVLRGAAYTQWRMSPEAELHAEATFQAAIGVLDAAVELHGLGTERGRGSKKPGNSGTSTSERSA